MKEKWTRKRSQDYGARKVDRQAIKEARKEGRATAAKPGKKRYSKEELAQRVQQKLETSLFGPEISEKGSGKRRRLSRRAKDQPKKLA